MSNTSGEFEDVDVVFNREGKTSTCKCGGKVFRNHKTEPICKCNACGKEYSLVGEDPAEKCEPEEVANPIPHTDKMSPEQRQEALLFMVERIRNTPKDIQTMEELIAVDKGWGRVLDSCVVLLLEQIKFVMKDVGLEGSPLEWLDRLVDFGVSRDSKMILRRLQQTRGIAKAYKEMAKVHPKKKTFKTELQERGMI